jgi:hypothetical protein
VIGPLLTLAMLISAVAAGRLGVLALAAVLWLAGTHAQAVAARRRLRDWPSPPGHEPLPRPTGRIGLEQPPKGEETGDHPQMTPMDADEELGF